MVDSYGGVSPTEVIETINLARRYTSVQMGFHGHNNLEMGLINSITALDNGCSIIDSTITGMGRGAGNLKTELLLTYLDSRSIIDVDLNELSHLVDDFEQLRDEYKWGTNLPYMVSGAQSLPQKDVMSWISKKRYSLGLIVETLTEQKTAEKNYSPFNVKVDKKTAVIIGGGKSVLKNQNGLLQYLERFRDESIIIHSSSRNSNLFEKCSMEQYFVLVGDEGSRLEKNFDKTKKWENVCVIPSRPNLMYTQIPRFVENNTHELSKVEFTDKYHDSPLALSIQAALQMGIKKIVFAGFDGYENLIERTQLELMQENTYLFSKLNDLGIEYYSLTLSKYPINNKSVYSFL